MSCDTRDFIYPLQAHIYYPISEESAYGNSKKQWNFDRTVACSLSPAGSSFKEELNSEVLLTLDSLLVGRFRNDLRTSSFGENFDINNILITNIVDKTCNQVYTESSGPRVGNPTVFEIATHQPFLNPFGKVEYYKVILKRSENQGVEL